MTSAPPMVVNGDVAKVCRYCGVGRRLNLRVAKGRSVGRKTSSAVSCGLWS